MHRNSVCDMRGMFAECGVFLRDTALVATAIKDVAASTEGECLEKCFADAACTGVSFKTGNRGGCWLHKKITGTKPDNGKDTYILCEGERGAHHLPTASLPPLQSAAMHLGMS